MNSPAASGKGVPLLSPRRAGRATKRGAKTNKNSSRLAVKRPKSHFKNRKIKRKKGAKKNRKKSPNHH
jgi:hypothetical protein